MWIALVLGRIILFRKLTHPCTLQMATIYVDDTGGGSNTLNIGGTPNKDVFLMRPNYIALVEATAVTEFEGIVGTYELVFYTPAINGGVVVNGYEVCGR